MVSRLRVKGKADAGPISTLAKFFRDFVEHRLRIVQAEEDSRATRLQLTQEEDVVDQLPHVLDLPPALLEERRQDPRREARRSPAGPSRRANGVLSS